MSMLNFLSSKVALGVAVGVVIGAAGYKVAQSKNINTKDLQKTVMSIADKVKKTFLSDGEASKGRGNVGGKGNGRRKSASSARKGGTSKGASAKDAAAK